MAEEIKIKEAALDEKTLALYINDDVEIAGYTASEKMLADSKRVSFIYLMEKNNEYTYIVLPEALWPPLKQAINLQIPVIITNGRDQVDLKGLHGELSYLINDIKDNFNYGEEMVAKIEAIF